MLQEGRFNPVISKNYLNSRLTKEVINHIGIYQGMNVDIQSLKNTFIQSRGSLDELKDESYQKNKYAAKAIEEYSCGYAKWR